MVNFDVLKVFFIDFKYLRSVSFFHNEIVPDSYIYNICLGKVRVELPKLHFLKVYVFSLYSFRRNSFYLGDMMNKMIYYYYYYLISQNP